MKKALLFTALMVVTAGLFAQTEKEVTTGAGYANDVYYSLENGTVTTVQRDNWDIAFTTEQFQHVSILANNGSGVELYTYTEGDTSAWSDLDITGMEWNPMYNSIETWSEGAFTRNYIPGDDFDYGWGRYSMITHEIFGDSLFLIKTVAGDTLKLVIQKRSPMANNWEFKFANLDGSNEESVFINSADYDSKSFVYYSLDNKEFIDREPATADWDLLFTKYVAMIPTDEGELVPYTVTGVLSNEDHILAQEVRESGLDQSTHISFEESDFTSDISVVGSDWKEFDMGSFAYVLADTVVYYLKSYVDTDSTYHKIYFTGFTGMSEGKYTFMQEEIIGVSTETPQIIQLLEVYPNPASDQLNVVLDREGELNFSIVDITGKTMYSSQYISGGFTNYAIDIAELNPGLFFLKLDSGAETQVVRFIKE